LRFEKKNSSSMILGFHLVFNIFFPDFFYFFEIFELKFQNLPEFFIYTCPNPYLLRDEFGRR
jgi:hypothetical protein